MKTTIADSIDCSLPQLLSIVAEVDEREFLSHLAGVSAQLETNDGDGPLFNRLAAGYLATAFIEASPLPQQSRTPPPIEHLFRLANGLPVRVQTPLKGPELTLHNNRMMLRLLARHEAYLGPLKHALGRTDLLMSRILPQVLRGRSDPRDSLRTALGATYVEVRDNFFGMYAWTLGHARVPAPFINRRTFSETTDPDRHWQVANIFAESRKELFERRQKHKGYHFRDDFDFRFAFSVLRDRPLVRTESGELIAPVARHLGLAFSTGVFDFLERHFEAAGGDALQNFDDVLGDVVENYVKERFDRELGAGSYVPLPDLGAGRLSPDGMTADGECVFELKAKRLLRGIITTGDITRAPNYLGSKRGLGRAVAQMLHEIARTRSGQGRGLSQERLDEVIPCLVTPDGLPGFHMAPIRKWVIASFETVVRAQFPDIVREISALDRFEWLSFEELDCLVRAARVESSSIARLLRRYRLERPATPLDGATGRFAPDLRAWLLARHLESYDDSWLDEAFSSTSRESSLRFFGVADDPVSAPSDGRVVAPTSPRRYPDAT